MRLEGRLTCGMDIVKAVIGFGPIGTYFDQSLLDGKVDKEEGMSLMSSAEHLKLAGISAGAEPNVQADWAESNNNSDAYIKNKPSIPAAQIQSDWNQSNTSSLDYIKNKPNLATVATSGSYSDLSNKPTIDSTPTSSSTNAVQSGGVYTALAGKQATLTFDDAPTSSSNNPVKSGGVYTALAGKQATLVGSGTGQNIKTVNSTSLVGSGNIVINGVTSITTQQDGTVVITVSSGDTYTINLNHNHSVLVSTGEIDRIKFHVCEDETEYTGISTKDSNTLYLIPEASS